MSYSHAWKNKKPSQAKTATLEGANVTRQETVDGNQKSGVHQLR